MKMHHEQTSWVKIQQSGRDLHIFGGGTWVATAVGEVDSILRGLSLEGVKNCVIDLQKATAFDISGAWIVERLIRELKGARIKYDLRTQNDHLTPILAQIEKYPYVKNIDFTRQPPLVQWIEEIGQSAYRLSSDAYHIIEFLGQLFITLFRCISQPWRLRVVSIVAILNRVGLNAVPIISLIAFLIGVVLVYQGAFQLQKFGAEIYTVDLLAISLLREIGILLTAIIVAGRSGSAFAAQIGSMKLNQEVDALRTFGLDPMEVLVVPRVIALVVVMPMLAFIADMIGLAGGAIMSYISLDISFNQYLHQLNQSFEPSSFWVGIIKAPFFGFVIAMIGCYEGMQVHGGSVSVGTKTTKAVVESIFLVIVLDAIFSILFTKLDF